MATKKSSSKNKKMRIAALVLMLFLAFYFMCFFVYQFISYKNAEIRTEVALKETVYNKIETKCFVLRDESFIKSSASGTTVSFAKNGQRIAAGDTVTMVFDSQDDAAAYLKMNEIKKDIEAFEKISGQSDIDLSNIDSLNRKIDKELYDYLDDVDSGKFRDAISDAELYLGTVTGKQIAVGEKLDVSKKLESLKKEYEEYNSKDYSYTKVTAENSGYYINGVDGYEKALDYSSLNEITAKDIEKAIASEPDKVSSDVIGRSVGAFKWYVLCVVDVQETVNLSFDKEYYLNFPYSGIEKLPVTLYSMGERTGDKVSLVFCCDRMNDDLADLRIEDVEIITEEYTGLKIPNSAIRTEDGVKGVYVIRGHLLGFRKIHVIYSDADFSLVEKPEDAESGYIRLYDLVVAEGVDLYDDKLV
ncbi:MAG: hypothetical protein E7533_00675 [Ruminococcaceae bacterium]|nr:hypothetical protein [Oscillospiraceae bacterium]